MSRAVVTGAKMGGDLATILRAHLREKLAADLAGETNGSHPRST